MKQIQEIVAFETASKISGWQAYGLSKAALNAYTVLLARQHPKLAVNSCTPGLILTKMTKDMSIGASKTPEEGTVSIRHLLFGKLGGNGWYYGSDGKRSPLHIVRNPGEIVYTGTYRGLSCTHKQETEDGVIG